MNIRTDQLTNCVTQSPFRATVPEKLYRCLRLRRCSRFTAAGLPPQALLAYSLTAAGQTPSNKDPAPAGWPRAFVSAPAIFGFGAPRRQELFAGTVHRLLVQGRQRRSAGPRR